jgi:lipopolysaccharide export system permease protein
MIFERYILRNYIGPFFFSMAVITFVFIMDFILRYIDLFLNKGVKFHIVLQAFTLSLGHMFALIIPMAVLPATLMTYGTLAGENELTAMRACGFSIYRMIFPGVVAATVLALGLVYYNNHVLPESNHKLLNLLIDINRKQPTVELRENHFIDDVQGYTIYFAQKNDRTGDISDVQIFRHNEKGLPSTIVAKRGKLKFIEGENILRVDLVDGQIHEIPEEKQRETYRRTSFKLYSLNIHDVDRSLQHTERDYRGDREMSVRMMKDKIKETRSEIAMSRQEIVRDASDRMAMTFGLLDKNDPMRRKKPVISSTGDNGSVVPDGRTEPAAARGPNGAGHSNGQNARPAPAAQPRFVPRPGHNAYPGVPMAARDEYLTQQRIETEINKQESFVKQIDRYKVEIHKKYSIPFACVVFVLVGSPLAIRMSRSGMNMAIGLSILFFLVYYVCLIGGEKLADRGFMTPFLSMWTPNIAFGALALVLLKKAASEQALFERPSLRFLSRFRFRRHAAANPR